MIPDWVSSLKITGDFRFRDQLQVRKVAGGSIYSHEYINRARIRARLNFEDQITDKIKVVVGLATDGGTSRSNNYTLGGSAYNYSTATGYGTGIENRDSFGKPAPVLNKAYAVYTPNSMITVMGGKLDNPIWEPGGSSFLWDPDITPEGGSIQVQKKLNDYITPWIQEDVFDLHNVYNATSLAVRTDPYMMLTQGGIKGNLTDKVFYKAGVSWYDVNNPDHFIFNETLNTNTQIIGPTGVPVYKYNYNNVIAEGAEFGMNDPFGELLPSPIYIPQIGLFGDYSQNQSSGDHDNKAWEAGAYVGNSALNGWGTWKLQSCFKVLERDSWLDILPDDDFYSGDTNTKGWRSQLDIGLAKNVWFTMAYFHDNVFRKIADIGVPSGNNPNGTSAVMSGSAPEDLFQMDLNFKF